MPEEQAPSNDEQQDVVQDTPEQSEEATPTEAQAESFTDSFNPEELPEDARSAYEDAYKKMQADYTRKTQEIAESRREAEDAMEFISALQDPEYRDQALRLLGVELDAKEAEGDDEEEWLTENERLDRIEQALESQAEQTQQAELEAMEDQFLDQEFTKLEKQIGRDLTDEEAELLFVTATHPAFRDKKGMPDVEAAFERINGLEKGAQQRYVESKKAPRAPLGSAGTKSVDLNDDEARTAALAQIIEASSEDS